MSNLLQVVIKRKHAGQKLMHVVTPLRLASKDHKQKGEVAVVVTGMTRLIEKQDWGKLETHFSAVTATNPFDNSILLLPIYLPGR